MLSKAKIKLITSLRIGKYRREHQCFVAEGNTLVTDFMHSSRLSVIEIFALESWLHEQPDIHHSIRLTSVTVEEMKKMSNLKNPSQVLALIAMEQEPPLDQISTDHWILALDDIHDPGNLGTLIRTAEWFGIQMIVCSKNTVDVYNPKVVQATMGSLARVSVVYTDLVAFFSEKPDAFPVYGTLLKGEDVRHLKSPKTGIILVGSEAHGISAALEPFIDTAITIPPAVTSKAESLNASIATAIICFALVKNVKT